MTRTGPTPFLLLTGLMAASIVLPLPGADGCIAHCPTICPFCRLTGLPCPGCGLTRAFVCLGHGHLLASLHWHPLGWLVYGICAGFWVSLGIKWLLTRSWNVMLPQTSPALSITGMTLFLAVGLARIVWLLVHHQSWLG